MSDSFKTGEYWDKHTQIDIIGLRNDNWTDIGECKWGTVKSSSALIKDLKMKISSYPNKRNATIQGRIFSKKNPNKIQKEMGFIWHSLKDIYNA